MKPIDRLRYPFWPVILVSGGLAALALAAFLVAFARSSHPQFLALAGLVALVLFAHALGAFFGRRGRFSLGIWLAASVQMLAAVVAALLASDYWIIGLLLFAVIPIEVGIADKLGRMPLAIVFSLLGAAAMLAIDLTAPAAPIALFAELPHAGILATGFLILHIVALGFLLWRLRLTPRSPFYNRPDLATQQTLVLTLIAAASVVLVTGVLISQIRTFQIEQVGENFQALAKINAERVGNSLEQPIETLIALGRRESVLLDGLAAANTSYPASKDQVQSVLQEHERLWESSPEDSDFILSYRSNPQTQELSKFRGSDLLFNNVILTDRYGGLVAAQGEKPARFASVDQSWWQAAWNDSQGGIYIGKLVIDQDTKLATIFIAVGVLNPQTNQIVGVLASTYELIAIQRDISAPKTQSTAEVLLLSQDGAVIAGRDQSMIGKPAWPGLYQSGVVTGHIAEKPGVIQGLDRENKAAIFAYAPLDTTSGIDLDPLRSLGWQVVVSDTQADALSGVTRSTKVASLFGLITMVLVVIAAIATVRVVTRPIENLTTTAAAISAGQLFQRAEPVGPIEMVTLAEAFNTLTAQLRSSINNLQDQVAQRTAQLEARAEQLATLNRITQAVASVSELASALGVVAREMVLLFNVRNSSIALLNEDRTLLTIVADHSIDNAYPSTLGITLPVNGNRSSETVLDTGHSIVITDPQNNPLTEKIHALMRERHTECLMIVPLLARGEVIGTIGLASNQPGRVFTEGEVALAETIAGQIAGAIQNALLFTETQKAMQAAEAANQTKSDFLANISHELRTPLTSVLGFARIIQKRLQERVFPAIQTNDPRLNRTIDQVNENIGIIIAEGERLTSLINDVLDLAKIEAGKVEWQVQPVSIIDVVERAISSTTALFDEKGLALIRDIPEGLPPLVGDRDRLIQVVINLLSNAVKFTQGGSVTCRIRSFEKEVIVSIIDTGIGIALADQPRVFEKFTQVGDTLTDKPQGTGLGLPICKEIIEHHGGHIWVESIFGQGSSFSFTLPVLRVSTGKPGDAPPNKGHSQSLRETGERLVRP